MILTVFRSRLKEEAQEEYKILVPHIVAEAEKMPGFLWRKSYVAEDGERLSLGYLRQFNFRDDREAFSHGRREFMRYK
ncbi:MAG: hypothetical protein RL497_560 [Pseudomonadota bacterium]|jgi:antibiotic biosynthesis monooxygenase (ABM) superfamily enzyme